MRLWILKKSNGQLTIEDMIRKNGLSNDEDKKELDKIKEIEKNVDWEKLIYKKDEKFSNKKLLVEIYMKVKLL